MMQEYVHTRWLGGHAKLLVNPIETYATDPMACQLAPSLLGFIQPSSMTRLEDLQNPHPPGAGHQFAASLRTCSSLFCKLFQNDTKFAAALRLCGGALPDPPSMSHNVHILSLRIIAAWEQPVLTLASCAKPRLVLRMTHPRRWMK